MIPITRKEVFYNAILNGGDTPTPVTREEMYLAQIAANGGGGGGGGGGSIFRLFVEDIDGNDVYTIRNTDGSTLTAGELIHALSTSACSIYTDYETDDYYYLAICQVIRILKQGDEYEMLLEYDGDQYSLIAATLADPFSTQGGR